MVRLTSLSVVLFIVAFIFFGLGLLVGGGAIDAYPIAATHFLKYAADIIKSLFPWPISIAALVWLLLFNERARQGVLRYLSVFESFSVMGSEFKLANSDAKRKFEKFAENFSDGLKEYREKMKQFLSDCLNETPIVRKLEELDTWMFSDQGVFLSRPSGFRVTLHAADFLFRDRLMQLTPYVPLEGNSFQVGRSFSTRRGVLGRVWRSKANETAGELFGDQDAGTMTRDEKILRIVKEWGMPFEEAEHALAKMSFICIYVKDPDEKRRSFLLYMDSTVAHGFSLRSGILESDVANKIEEKLVSLGMVSHVRKLIEKLQSSSPQITLFQGIES